MRRRVVLFVIVAMVLAAASTALARPGGGGSYHGGGNTGGGFSGGGGGYSGGTGLNHGGGGTSLGPVGALILLGFIGGIVLLVMVSKARQARGPRAEQYDAMAATRPSASLAPLQGRDPALTEQSISAHVMPMSEHAPRAPGARGTCAPPRPFVSDGVYSRFQVQLALMRQENRRNVMGEAQRRWR